MVAGAELGQGCLSSPQSKSGFYIAAVMGHSCMAAKKSAADLEAGIFQWEAGRVPFTVFHVDLGQRKSGWWGGLPGELRNARRVSSLKTQPEAS